MHMEMDMDHGHHDDHHDVHRMGGVHHMGAGGVHHDVHHMGGVHHDRYGRAGCDRYGRAGFGVHDDRYGRAGYNRYGAGVHPNYHQRAYHRRQQYIPPAPMPHQMRLDADGRTFIGSYNQAFANAGKLSEAEFHTEIDQINTVFKSTASTGPAICTGATTIIMFIAGAIGIGVHMASSSMGFPLGFVFFPIGMCFCVATGVVYACSARKGLRAVNNHLAQCNT
eukprot:302537_1